MSFSFVGTGPKKGRDITERDVIIFKLEDGSYGKFPVIEVDFAKNLIRVTDEHGETGAILGAAGRKFSVEGFFIN